VCSSDLRAFSELYQIRGEIYLEKGNKEAARREFELALKYNKNFQPAKTALQNL
jgi:predicted negative regulator of RcsB-dependent stress response